MKLSYDPRYNIAYIRLRESSGDGCSDQVE